MQYLSNEWLAAANEALAETPAPGDGRVDSPAPSERVRIGYTVLGGPLGDRSYVVELGPNPRFEPDRTDAPVTLSLRYDDAVSIATGAASAQRAFLDGAIRLGGDVTVLLGSAGDLAAIEDRLASVRAATTY